MILYKTVLIRFSVNESIYGSSVWHTFTNKITSAYLVKCDWTREVGSDTIEMFKIRDGNYNVKPEIFLEFDKGGRREISVRKFLFFWVTE